jgi:hypothetical protein
MARTALRILKGLRSSGNIRDGTLIASVPAPVLDALGAGALEALVRLDLEQKGRVPFTEILHTKKSETRFGFNILVLGDLRVLYRVAGSFVEILLIPVDGIVARFERAPEHAKLLRFSLFNVFHFGQAPPGQEDGIALGIRRAYDTFAAPLVDIHALRKSAGELWSIRRGAIAAALVLVLLLLVGVFALSYAEAVLQRLTETETSVALQSVAAILAIVASAVYLSRWVYIRIRPKPPK